MVLDSSKIILLNGASSAGKSTLAKSLQWELVDPFWHVSSDQLIQAQLLPAPRASAGPFSWAHMRPRFFDAFHHCIASIAAAGNNLIVDHVIEFQEWMSLLLRLLDPYDVFFVGIHCPPDDLARREHQRGDRYVGEALEHLADGVHARKVYDLEVDTSRGTPGEIAHLVAAAWRRRTRPSAFERMRASR